MTSIHTDAAAVCKFPIAGRHREATRFREAQIARVINRQVVPESQFQEIAVQSDINSSDGKGVYLSPQEQGFSLRDAPAAHAFSKRIKNFVRPDRRN